MVNEYYDKAPLAPLDSPYLFDFTKTNASISEVFDSFLPLPLEVGGDSVPIEGSEKQGFSPVYRNKGFLQELKKAYAPELDTYYKLFENSVKANGTKPCFGSRKFDYKSQTSAPQYTFKTFNEVNEMKKFYGAGVMYLLSHNPYKNSAKYESHRKIDTHYDNYGSFDKDNISFIFTMYSGNREEWVLSDLMCTSFSITSTALYDTLGPESSEYILELTESPIVATSKANIYKIVDLKQKYPEKLGALVSVITFDALNLANDHEDQALYKACKLANITLFDLNQVIQIGKMFPSRELPPTRESLYTISFTSGTSGSKSKGVMLEHSAIAAAVCFQSCHVPHYKDGKMFAFLPLAHIFEREDTAFSLTMGMTVGFPQVNGTPLSLIEDLQLYKPTHMCNVPRVLTKFESSLKAGTVDASSALKRKIFSSAFNTKIALQEQYDGASGNHLVIDNLVCTKTRLLFGFDDCKYLITGSAPIRPSTLKFLKASLNVGIAQGYGLTETFAGLALSSIYEAEPGSNGPIAVTSEMKIRGIPEMGYSETDPEGPRGELLLKGYQNMAGYYKNEEETKAAVDEEGWFHTGDIARISQKTGRLYIIDRVKNFFKLSIGEYITPEKVETSYMANNSILTQCFAHGNSLQSFLVGIVGIDLEGALSFLHEHEILDKTQGRTVALDDVLRHLNKKEVKTKLLHQLNSNVSVQGFEKLHNIHVAFEPLSMENDLLTPTVKVKRPIATKYYKEVLDGLYDEGSLIRVSKI